MTPKHSVILICTLSLVLTLSQTVRACMCSYSSAEGAFRGADVVFVGKVVRMAKAKQASVGLLVKESGTLEVLKVPRWEKSSYDARIVTLEISEPFKGTSVKTIDVLTAIYDGGATCGVNFRLGQSYLVYALKRQPLLSDEEARLPKAEWTVEIQLKADADKFNRTCRYLGRAFVLERSIFGGQRKILM